MQQLAVAQQNLELIIPAERLRLVRLCALLSGDSDAAEDLAQETIYEAWRHADSLRDPDRRSQWLSGIARNVCLRWRRKQRQEVSRWTSFDTANEPYEAPEPTTGEFEVELELERRELAELLDRAMALLPPTTRLVLMERYVREVPQAEVAARLGLSEGAVAMRLQRGKLALRRVLAGDLEREIATNGPVEAAGWQETGIWCPRCGGRKLLGHFALSDERFLLRCPDCNPVRGEEFWDATYDGPFHGTRTFKLALNHGMAWAHDYFRQAIARNPIICPACEQEAAFEVRTPENLNDWSHGKYTALVRCPNCGSGVWAGLRGLAQVTPEVRRFWREHPRMISLPETEIEIAGRPAVVSTFRSLTSSDSIAVVQARDTLDLIGIHRS